MSSLSIIFSRGVAWTAAAVRVPAASAADAWRFARSSSLIRARSSRMASSSWSRFAFSSASALSPHDPFYIRRHAGQQLLNRHLFYPTITSPPTTMTVQHLAELSFHSLRMLLTNLCVLGRGGFLSHSIILRLCRSFCRYGQIGSSILHACFQQNRRSFGKLLWGSDKWSCAVCYRVAGNARSSRRACHNSLRVSSVKAAGVNSPWVGSA